MEGYRCRPQSEINFDALVILRLLLLVGPVGERIERL